MEGAEDLTQAVAALCAAPAPAIAAAGRLVAAFPGAAPFVLDLLRALAAGSGVGAGGEPAAKRAATQPLPPPPPPAAPPPPEELLLFALGPVGGGPWRFAGWGR
jgi:hypothetical protein